MNEAEEVLKALRECVAEASNSAVEAFDAIFALHRREFVFCDTCPTPDRGTRLETTLYEGMELVYCADASAVRQLLEDGGGKPRFGSLLRLCGKEFQQRCSACGSLQAACCAITNSPAVLTVGLAWKNDDEAGDSIVAALKGVKSVLHLKDVNADAQGSAVGMYRLCAAVAYYGKHYTALVYKPKVGWVSVDDTLVTKVGQKGRWYEVMRKCKQGRLQLTTLFYIREARPR